MKIKDLPEIKDKIQLPTSVTKLATFSMLMKVVVAHEPLSSADSKPLFMAAKANGIRKKPAKADTHTEGTFRTYGLIEYTDDTGVMFKSTPLGKEVAAAYADDGNPTISSDEMTDLSLRVLCSWTATNDGRDIHPGRMLLDFLSDVELDGYVTEHEFTNFLIDSTIKNDRQYAQAKVALLAFRAKGADAICDYTETCKTYLFMPPLVKDWHLLKRGRTFEFAKASNSFKWTMGEDDSEDAGEEDVPQDAGELYSKHCKVTEYRMLPKTLEIYKHLSARNGECHPMEEKSFGPLQRVTYGAPGTGKSKGVNDKALTLPKEDVVRTTFHPDSDYSTFVGAYKPTMVRELEEKEDKHLSIDQLTDILKKEYDAAGEGSDKGKALAVDLFAEQYHEYLDGRFGKVSLSDLLSKAGMPKGYNVGLRDSINVAKYHVLEKVGKKRISYEFVPQAFAKAYVQAWKRMAEPVDGKPLPVLLVIEEINRGDCAKVFGDLFQLLDRRVKDDEQHPEDALKKAGFSEYPVQADSDLADYIRRALEDDEIEALTNAGYAMVVANENLQLVLPPNMYIWATMNTSDQSLFPMDSAFKRRWDWKYVPIEDKGKDWKIKVGSDEYKWWSFLKQINDQIAEYTSSEDKQLGYFFAQPGNGGAVIDAETFVSKVIFYLWKDVFRDDLPQGKPFKYKFKKGNDDVEREIRFADFYQADLRDALVSHFLGSLGVEKVSVEQPGNAEGGTSADESEMQTETGATETAADGTETAADETVTAAADAPSN